jgi:hypothetical protein
MLKINVPVAVSEGQSGNWIIDATFGRIMSVFGYDTTLMRPNVPTDMSLTTQNGQANLAVKCIKFP